MLTQTLDESMKLVKVQVTPLSSSLEKADFFAISGVAMKIDEHRVKICGHQLLHTFNTQTGAFEGSSQC